MLSFFPAFFSWLYISRIKDENIKTSPKIKRLAPVRLNISSVFGIEPNLRKKAEYRKKIERMKSPVGNEINFFTWKSPKCYSARSVAISFFGIASSLRSSQWPYYICLIYPVVLPKGFSLCKLLLCMAGLKILIKYYILLREMCRNSLFLLLKI